MVLNKKQLKYVLAAIAVTEAKAKEVLQTAVGVKVNTNGNTVGKVEGPGYRRLMDQSMGEVDDDIDMEDNDESSPSTKRASDVQQYGERKKQKTHQDVMMQSEETEEEEKARLEAAVMEGRKKMDIAFQAWDVVTCQEEAIKANDLILIADKELFEAEAAHAKFCSEHLSRRFRMN